MEVDDNMGVNLDVDLDLDVYVVWVGLVWFGLDVGCCEAL
jgi:hypothetical protein